MGFELPRAVSVVDSLTGSRETAKRFNWQGRQMVSSQVRRSPAQAAAPVGRYDPASAQWLAFAADYLDNAAVAMHWVDRHGMILWANSAEMDLLGYEADEYIGRPIADFHADQPVIHDILRRLTADETLHNYEARLRCKNGDIRDVLISSNVLRGSNGEFIHTRCVTRDVTDRGLAQAAIQLANEQLAAAVRLKDEVLGLVSHELRTPLTTLKGGTRLLSRSLDPAQEEQRTALAEIEASTERLERLIENMLILARVDNGDRPEREPVLMHRLVAAAAQQCQIRHPGRHVQFFCENELPPVFGNELYIAQIAENLLENAAKYSPEGSPVEIAVGRRGDFVETIISDRGRGISEEGAAQLFEPFFRDQSTAGLAPGLGLGLAVCRRLIDEQAGCIEVRPRDGGGCCFTFAIPVFHAE